MSPPRQHPVLSSLGSRGLELPKLLRPGTRWGKTNFVLADKGAKFGQPVLRAEVGVGVAAAEGLLFAIELVQRRVKSGGGFH